MPRVIFIGISGASCSGKTTLAKHLLNLLPNSFIIHQDDFAPPQDDVPIHPLYNVKDWDSAKGAVLWDKFANFLEKVRKTGEMPLGHRSHDHLNEFKEIKMDDDIKARWKTEFERLRKENEGEEVVWVLVDGFLLYWHKAVYDQLDVRIMLREPQEVLKQRRHERVGYHTAVRDDPEGTFWQDPPNYWEEIVWPAYLDAHKEIFEGGDVEHGKLTSSVEGIVLLDTLDISMTEEVAIQRSCQVIHRVALEIYGTKIN